MAIELLRGIVPSISYQSNRAFSVSSVNLSCRMFKRFTLLYRGTEHEKKKQKENPNRRLPGWSKGVRYPGYWIGQRFVFVPECVPDIIVPDLTDCEFKPYVSYRTDNAASTEFIPQDLFDAVYTPKIEHDFQENKLDENDNPLTPSEEEALTATEAYANARKTGSDYFTQTVPTPNHYEIFHIE